MIEVIVFLVGAFLLVGLTLAVLHQFSQPPKREYSFLDDFDIESAYGPDERTFEERLEQQRRFLKFQGLLDK